MLGAGSNCQHNLGRVERRKNDGLIRRTKLSLKGYSGIENLKSLLRELVVNVVCNYAVLRSLALGVGLFVANKYVVAFLFLRQGKNLLLYAVNFLCLLLVQNTLADVGIFYGRFVVVVGNNRVV